MFLCYQPLVDLHTHQIIGFEALVRWNHPQLGIISPIEFIPIAEESLLIIPIGYWIFETALNYIQSLNNLYHQSYRIAINISVVQLQDFHFYNHMMAILQKTGFDSHLVDLEITEGILIEAFEETLIILNEFKKLGFQLALDDFGTGYSSLSYLQKLPINLLKIDRSFISELNIETQHHSLVISIIEMAHKLNLKVIAEGIETSEQRLLLSQYHCDFGQGYFMSKPLSCSQLELYLDEHNQPILDQIKKTD